MTDPRFVARGCARSCEKLVKFNLLVFVASAVRRHRDQFLLDGTRSENQLRRSTAWFQKAPGHDLLDST